MNLGREFERLFMGVEIRKKRKSVIGYLGNLGKIQTNQYTDRKLVHESSMRSFAEG